MNNELQNRLAEALERPHRLGMIGGDLGEQLAHCASFSRVVAQILGDTTGGDTGRGEAAGGDTMGRGRAYDLGSGGGYAGHRAGGSHP